MASDSKVVLDVDVDVDVPRVALVHKKASSSTSGVWRTCGVLLAVALCAAAVVCFAKNKTQNQPDESQAEIKHALRQISQTAKAAIHLSGHYNQDFSNISVQWFDNTDQSFASGLRLKNNEIQIQHSGLYFVYSQASYRLSCTTEDEDDAGQVMDLSHTVSRWSDSYDSWKPLLSTTRSACKKTSLQEDEEDYLSWYGAIYVGAAFNLEAGDKLRTVMDHNLLPNVESAGGKTFFGAFSL